MKMYDIQKKTNLHLEVQYGFHRAYFHEDDQPRGLVVRVSGYQS